MVTPSPPSFPTPTGTPPIPPDATSTAFYHLLLSSPDIASTSLSLLADALLNQRIATLVQSEMKMLAGELRDEWKVRVGAIKADWMARYISAWDPEKEEEAGAEEDRKATQPVIIPDADAKDAMSVRVDAAVNSEFVARLAEAETRIRKAVEEKERLEVEVFIGSLLLDARAEEDNDEAVAEAVKMGLRHALEMLDCADPTLGSSEDAHEYLTSGVERL